MPVKRNILQWYYLVRLISAKLFSFTIDEGNNLEIKINSLTIQELEYTYTIGCKLSLEFKYFPNMV